MQDESSKKGTKEADAPYRPGPASHDVSTELLQLFRDMVGKLGASAADKSPEVLAILAQFAVLEDALNLAPNDQKPPNQPGAR